jgi:hypothetical protein
MPDIDESSSADKFTIVDKRRVTDETEAEDGDEQTPSTVATEPQSTEERIDQPEQQASIYDIAAYCTGLLITEGFQRMGIIGDPRTGKAVVDLPSARVAIDCVAALVTVLDEPASTLPEPVRREMKRTLNDLRLNYIDRTRG